MHRRTFLSLVTASAVVLGGCQDGERAVSPTTGSTSPTAKRPTADATPAHETATENPTETYAGMQRDPRVDVNLDEPRTASIVDLVTVPRTCAFHPRVKTDVERVLARRFRETATAAHPAIVVGVLQNGTDGAWPVPVGEIFPFGPLVSDSPRPPSEPCGESSGDRRSALVLAPTANHDLVEDPPTTYHARDGRWRVDAATDRAERPVIAEQVMNRLPGLRNTLEFFGSIVERVVLRTAHSDCCD